MDVATASVVYPFTEPGFAAQLRPGREAGKTRVLFAGRLSPEKGIYTLLETLHIDIIEQDPGLTFTATTVGADKPQGKIIVAHSQRGQRADRNSAIALHCIHGQAGAASQRTGESLQGERYGVLDFGVHYGGNLSAGAVFITSAMT